MFVFIETSRNMQIYRSLLLNSYNYLTNIIVGGFLLIRSVFAQAILIT